MSNIIVSLKIRIHIDIIRLFISVILGVIYMYSKVWSLSLSKSSVGYITSSIADLVRMLIKLEMCLNILWGRTITINKEVNIFYVGQAINIEGVWHGALYSQLRCFNELKTDCSDLEIRYTANVAFYLWPMNVSGFDRREMDMMLYYDLFTRHLGLTDLAHYWASLAQCGTNLGYVNIRF